MRIHVFYYNIVAPMMHIYVYEHMFVIYKLANFNLRIVVIFIIHCSFVLFRIIYYYIPIMYICTVP